jgi:N-glycosylase/DNA lyase
METDYEALIDSIDPDDVYLTAAAEFGRGIRILKQNPWEMLITFIISQRRSIPSIKTCVEALCRRWGRPIGDGLYAFPTPEELACASICELSGCSLGYRAEYVYLAAQGVGSGEVDLSAMEKMPDAELFAALTALRGVGPKVANCVSLFGFYRTGAFPIDVWIDRVLKEHYPDGFPMDRYEGFAGVMQQYMFFAARKA